MATIKLSNVTAEITNVQVSSSAMAAPTMAATSTGSGKTLNFNVVVKMGTKELSNSYKSFPLEGEDLKVPVDGLEALASAKFSAELGL